MGMFDSVFVPCCKCLNPVEFQSKGGPCTLAAYDPEEVPADVASDLGGYVKECPKCKTPLEVRTDQLPTVRAWTVKAGDGGH